MFYPSEIFTFTLSAIYKLLTMPPNQGKIDALGGNDHGFMNRHRKVSPDKREVINEEDYNPPSKRRTYLLGRLNTVLNNRPVPASFWAALLLSDMEMLEKMVIGAEKSTFLLEFFIHGCMALPLLWKQCRSEQRATTAQLPHPPADAEVHGTLREEQWHNHQTSERDRGKCVVRRVAPMQIVEIYPRSLSNPELSRQAKAYPPFWDMLKYFWTPKRIAEWRQQIFSDRRSPMQALDNLSNLMCLSADLKQMWALGIFALKPLAYSEDRTQLEVQFFWQPRPGHSINHHIPLLTRPSSSRDLPGLVEDDVVQTGSAFLNVRSEWQKIMSGQRFTFTTPDPIKLPLPSKELLEMQWVLTRLVNLSGAGLLPDGHELDHYENDGTHRFQLF
ncbi:hypothetical protein ASPCAL03985 [Aspergillus calidoustus]|uniref:Uncharacterized protein n=1 Tax=Aspergillus calidoustus TaxID=454130 RepID=A0A0U5FU68_ASPCI|nr:hypothetical protein ASPCAL03985 [Aspergillus calidoustus]